jgi:molecular chaperone DnaJ
MAKPSETKDFYQRLGISRDASQEEIKSAYRKLAHQWHPDKNPGEENESRLEFIAVSEAYRELSEEGKKYFGETNQSDNPDSYKIYEEYFNIFEKINPELAQAMKMWFTPNIFRSFRF